MIFEESSDRLEEWLDKVLKDRIDKPDRFMINQEDVES
jgi:hypothetical protein